MLLDFAQAVALSWYLNQQKISNQNSAVEKKNFHRKLKINTFLIAADMCLSK